MRNTQFDVLTIAVMNYLPHHVGRMQRDWCPKSQVNMSNDTCRRAFSTDRQLGKRNFTYGKGDGPTAELSEVAHSEAFVESPIQGHPRISPLLIGDCHSGL